MIIFITGIAGTVGRAFVELLKDNYEIAGVDRNEENVVDFKREYPGIKVSTGDFSEVDFESSGVFLLIHLAAMKHIDLCETNPNACVVNNVIKTYELFKNAHKNFVDVLFMSTDKAVEPNSIYGYSKALAEGMVLDYGGAFARSGNVVKSSGSVLSIWDEAIENGQPIKITHKDMRRFFITAENLVKRIWEQYSIGIKEIIPAMDRDVYLVDLAEEKLRSHGYTLDNYPGGIEYIGLRPGEKLSERLIWPGVNDKMIQ